MIQSQLEKISIWWLTNPTVHNSNSIVTRFQIVGEICCATTICACPSLLVAALKAEYTVGKAPINIIASHTELEVLPSLTFSIPKVQSLEQKSCPSYLHCGVLQIDGLVIYGGLKRRTQRESEELREKAKAEIKCWNFYSIWCQTDLDLDFSIRSEYRNLPSE